MLPLALEQAESYVAGAYMVFVALLLIYVAIMAAKLQRIQGELRSLAKVADPDSPDRTAGTASRRQSREVEAVRGEPRR